MASASTTRAPLNPHQSDSRFDRRLAQILDFATEVFAEKGYEGASMRDLSRRSGISLAGLYYYFDSKEKLLYFIQKHTFTTILERLGERLATTSDPEERIRLFVSNHVEYAVGRQQAMTVLSHEDDALRERFGDELAEIKREYYRICVGLVDDLINAESASSRTHPDNNGAEISTRTAVMGLFGMMNWLYTWYNPRIDPSAKSLAEELSNLFLRGLHCGIAGQATNATKSAVRSNKNFSKDKKHSHDTGPQLKRETK